MLFCFLIVTERYYQWQNHHFPIWILLIFRFWLKIFCSNLDKLKRISYGIVEFITEIQWNRTTIETSFTSFSTVGRTSGQRFFCPHLVLYRWLLFLASCSYLALIIVGWVKPEVDEAHRNRFHNKSGLATFSSGRGKNILYSVWKEWIMRSESSKKGLNEHRTVLCSALQA